MHPLLHQVRQTITRCFTGYYLLAQIAAVAMTYIIVMSGFDFMYHVSFNEDVWQTFFFPAVVIGGILPVIAPLWLLAYGALFNHKKITLVAWMLAQAAAIGWVLSSIYKAFTGRVPPTHTVNSLIDMSREFHFGFFEEGIFWGWPSSHTTIAFAMAFVIWGVYHKHRWVGYLALFYATYIGVGISMNILWFSEFVAGALFGAVVGLSVVYSFKKRLER